MRMKHDAPIKRRPVNLYLSETLVADAKRLQVNISRACEAGLIAAVRDADARLWEEENRGAIEGWNRWTAKNGLPLARYRMF